VELLTSPRADDLSELLERINVRSAVYCLSDLGAPWGLRVDGSATAKFHLVLDGRATLTLDDPGGTSVELSAGELVLLPHGSGHLMQDRRGSPARPLDHILAERSPEAAERLATDKTVRQIAHMVGYENESSLSKAFRRAFGRAPGEYRRQQAAAHGVRATFTA